MSGVAVGFGSVAAWPGGRRRDETVAVMTVAQKQAQ